MLGAVSPGLGRVGRQSGCLAGSESILWPGKVALCRSDQCEPQALLRVVKESSEWV